MIGVIPGLPVGSGFDKFCGVMSGLFLFTHSFERRVALVDNPSWQLTGAAVAELGVVRRFLARPVNENISNTNPMQLDYSFNGIPPLFYSGALPFPDMRTEKVKVSIAGSADGRFPPIFSIGDLLCYHRAATKESAVTLLLTYRAGTTPPATEPPPLGKWVDVPNSPIYGQIRVALTREAIDQIRQMSGDGYSYELALDAHFINKTGSA